MSEISSVAATPAGRVRKWRVFNKQRLAKNGRVRAWADEWEFSGHCDLQIPKTGGVRFDDEREPDGQRWIWAEGRTRSGTITTNARTADEAPHVHDAANDFHPVRQLDANGNVALVYLGNEADAFVRAEGLRLFGLMADHVRAFGGLKPGADFGDLPHVEDLEWKKYPVAIRPLATT